MATYSWHRHPSGYYMDTETGEAWVTRPSGSKRGWLASARLYGALDSEKIEGAYHRFVDAKRAARDLLSRLPRR